MHEHNECEHNLKYCSKCDVVYCTKCKREWGGHSHYWWPYWTWSSGTTTIPCSEATCITDGSDISCDTTNDASTVAYCNHN